MCNFFTLLNHSLPASLWPDLQIIANFLTYTQEHKTSFNKTNDEYNSSLTFETRVYIFLKGSITGCTCLACDTTSIRNPGLALTLPQFKSFAAVFWLSYICKMSLKFSHMSSSRFQTESYPVTFSCLIVILMCL